MQLGHSTAEQATADHLALSNIAYRIEVTKRVGGASGPSAALPIELR